MIITLHIGGATFETLRRGAELATAAIAGLLDGAEPRHLANPEVLPRRRDVMATPPGPYLLAFNAGTGSCRAVLFTDTGQQVESSWPCGQVC